MLSDNIYAKLLPIFQDVFDRDDIVVGPELSASDVIEWDSLSNIRLFVAIEQAFSIRFTSDEVTTLQNVGELVDAIESKRA